MKRGSTIAAGLVLAGALLVGIASFATPAAAQQNPNPPAGDMGGMMNMMGGTDMGGMMQMMQAMNSPEHQAMVEGCTKFMNSPAGQQMMRGMGGTVSGSR